MDKEGAEMTSAGRSFQTRAPATEFILSQLTREPWEHCELPQWKQAVFCLVVHAFICIDLLISRVLKINDDDDDDDDDEYLGLLLIFNTHIFGQKCFAPKAD